MSNCNCLNDVLGKVEAKLKENLPATAVESSLKVEYAGRVFRLDGRSNDVMLPVNASYQDVKRDGSWRKSRTKCDTAISMAYCPFCGSAYE